MTLAATQGPVLSLVKGMAGILEATTNIERLGGRDFPHAVGLAVGLAIDDRELIRVGIPSRWSSEYAAPCERVAYAQCATREVTRSMGYVVSVGICNKRMLNESLREENEAEKRLASSVALVVAWKVDLLSWGEVISRAEGASLDELARFMRSKPA